MSTYLLALIISEFKYAEAPGNVLPGKIVRVSKIDMLYVSIEKQVKILNLPWNVHLLDLCSRALYS